MEILALIALLGWGFGCDEHEMGTPSIPSFDKHPEESNNIIIDNLNKEQAKL